VTVFVLHPSRVIPREPRPVKLITLDTYGVTLTVGFRYEIRVRGRLTRTLIAEFEQLELEAAIAPIETILHGPVQDQAALHGLLRRVEALGLELVEVRRFPPESASERPSRAG
jgi:hypothetical protein